MSSSSQLDACGREQGMGNDDKKILNICVCAKIFEYNSG